MSMSIISYPVSVTSAIGEIWELAQQKDGLHKTLSKVAKKLSRARRIACLARIYSRARYESSFRGYFTPIKRVVVAVCWGL